MDQAFVDELASQMANICAEYDVTMTTAPAQDHAWLLTLHNEDGEELESALISDDAVDPSGVVLIKMIISETDPWTAYVSAVPKAIFGLLWV